MTSWVSRGWGTPFCVHCPLTLPFSDSVSGPELGSRHFSLVSLSKVRPTHFCSVTFYKVSLPVTDVALSSLHQENGRKLQAFGSEAVSPLLPPETPHPGAAQHGALGPPPTSLCLATIFCAGFGLGS